MLSLLLISCAVAVAVGTKIEANDHNEVAVDAFLIEKINVSCMSHTL